MWDSTTLDIILTKYVVLLFWTVVSQYFFSSWIRILNSYSQEFFIDYNKILDTKATFSQRMSCGALSLKKKQIHTCSSVDFIKFLTKLWRATRLTESQCTKSTELIHGLSCPQSGSLWLPETKRLVSQKLIMGVLTLPSMSCLSVVLVWWLWCRGRQPT